MDVRVVENAVADINFDACVDAADLGLLVAAWGDAPRIDYPPSDCPLGLIPGRPSRKTRSIEPCRLRPRLAA